MVDAPVLGTVNNRNEATLAVREYAPNLDGIQANFSAILVTINEILASQLFTLGPTQNIFDGATRASAETARDQYATNNPTWLPQYDADSQIGIYLTFVENGEDTVVSQVRVNSAWRDVQTVVAIQGTPGPAASFSGVSENNIPAIGPSPSFAPFDSGLSIDAVGNFVAVRKIEIPSASIRFDELLEISEGSGDLIVNNRLTGEIAEIVSVRSRDDAVSGRPTIFSHLEVENDFIIQGVDTDTITSNPLSFQYTTQLNAQTNAIKLRTASAMSNGRLRIVDNATGIAIKHLPDKATWDSGTGGVDLRAGENIINLMSEAADDPVNGIFNIGITPFRFRAGRVLDIEVRADTMAVLGTTSPTPFPYFVAVVQRSADKQVALFEDVQRVRTHVFNFAIPTLPSRVSLTGDLIASYTANYEVTNSNLMSIFNLVIQAVGGDGNMVQKSLTSIPTVDGPQSFIFDITSGDWAVLSSGGPTSITFTLSGTDSHSNVFTSNTLTVERRNLSANEFYYHGLMSSSDTSATVVLGNLGSTELSAGQHTFEFSVGPAVGGETVILLYPTSKPVTSIINTQSNNEVIQEFTLESDVRNDPGENYSSRTLANVVAGYQATYRVTAGS